jgi:predicted transcriptional regulator
MATLTVKLSDDLLKAFEAKYPPEQRDEVLVGALIELVQDDPYSEAAFAEDERRYQHYLATGRYYTTEQVMERLRSLKARVDAQ